MDVLPTERFSDRVEDYVKYRPAYPRGVLDIFREKLGLRACHVVADIGSGTGISSEVFLKNGNTVYGIEPNAKMRAAAESALQFYLGFHSYPGQGEATGLPSRCADFIVAAQAFHWFDPVPTKKEFKRILKPGGSIALIWNDRRVSGSAFAAGYEALLAEFLDGYSIETVYNCQDCDFESLRGRLASSSYAPNVAHPDYNEMLKSLKTLFDQTSQNGIVRIKYDTQVYYSHW